MAQVRNQAQELVPEYYYSSKLNQRILPQKSFLLWCVVDVVLSQVDKFLQHTHTHVPSLDSLIFWKCELHHLKDSARGKLKVHNIWGRLSFLIFNNSAIIGDKIWYLRPHSLDDRCFERSHLCGNFCDLVIRCIIMESILQQAIDPNVIEWEFGSHKRRF